MGKHPRTGRMDSVLVRYNTMTNARDTEHGRKVTAGFWVCNQTSAFLSHRICSVAEPPRSCAILAIRTSRPIRPRRQRKLMAEISEVKVPDIGNYCNVPVIEVLVKAGDTVGKDQGLVTLESDKATMEVPAPFAGVIREVKVKVGDELSEGSVVALIEASGAAAAAPLAKVPAPAPAPAP